MTTPIPPQAPRTDAVARLRRELWLARNTGEHRLAAQIEARITALTTPPPETTAAAPPTRETTSRTRTRRPHVPRP